MANPFEYLARKACQKLEENTTFSSKEKIEIFDIIFRNCFYALRTTDFALWRDNLSGSFREEFPMITYSKTALDFLEEVFNSLDMSDSKMKKIANLKFKEKKQNPFLLKYIEEIQDTDTPDMVILKHMFLTNISCTTEDILFLELCDKDINFHFFEESYSKRLSIHDLELKWAKFNGELLFTLEKGAHVEEIYKYF